MIVAGSASPLLLSSAGGYNLTNSLRFRSSASAYLNRTPASAGNRKTWTWSGWVKRGTLGTNQSIFTCYFANNDTSYLTISFTSDNLNIGLWNTSILYTSAVYRDPSAWYHIVLAVDTTQATASNRAKLYVNGVQVTAFGSTGYPTQNTDLAVNAAQAHYISTYDGTNYKFDGYLAEVNFIDGQALTPSSFGETSATTGVWIPKKYTGTYGTNGFYLPFTDNSALTTSSNAGLGKDFSGNANYWTTNNISITSGSTYDSMTDVPTLTSATTANYATWNPLPTVGSTSKPTFSEGNLTVAFPSFGYAGPLSTLSLPTQNTYCEITCASVGGGGYSGVGIAELFADLSGNVVPTKCVTYGPNGGKTVSGAFSSYGSSFTTGDIIGIAYDYSGNQVTFYKNNVSQGALSLSSLSGALFFCCHATSGAITWTANFGQRPFAYTPPTGFNRLNTFNLPTPTIGATASTTANKYFDINLWTGTGTTNVITNSGSMQPDFVWAKRRSSAASHGLVDSVRGTGKTLFSNLTDAEDTGDSNLTAFNSNGFTAGSGGNFNTSGQTYVGWQWRASNATAVTNTAGSITSTVSANTTAGFSVVTYTGTGANATVGHGLGVAPSMVIYKRRSASDGWAVYFSSIGAANNLVLQSTAAQQANGNVYWNSTAPTSTVFTAGTDSAVNASTATYVAYCFAQVAGYSAFGSYTGNGSTDGPFIFTGFRPRFIMTKNITTGGYWWEMVDSARSPYNTSNVTLYANVSDSEYTSSTYNKDLVSNGFKIRGTSAAQNSSGDTFIYMAFCESPFKFSNAR
jgi:hypothetical protein